MFCYGTFVVGMIFSLIASGIWFGATESAIINSLASLNIVHIEAMSGWGVPKWGIDYWNGIVTIISWNYPYLNNAWGWVFKLLFLYPVTIGVIYSLVQLAISVIQGIASSIRSLMPGS
jgi:hypothetical protein